MTSILRLALAICILAVATPSLAQTNSCRTGFVWREANAGDHVCVTPQIRAQISASNAAAPGHTQPGSDVCLAGYVWREADAGDRVCVTPQFRAQVRQDNALAANNHTSATSAATDQPAAVAPPLRTSATPAETTGAPSERSHPKFLTAPLPPLQTGCFRAPLASDAVRWHRVPCLSPAELAQVPRLQPLLQPGLQSPAAPWFPSGTLTTPGIQTSIINVTSRDDQRRD